MIKKDNPTQLQKEYNFESRITTINKRSPLNLNQINDQWMMYVIAKATSINT